MDDFPRRNRMRVLLYADFRSTHAKEWARGLRDCGIDVIELSSESTSEHASPGGLARLRSRILHPGSPLAKKIRAQFGNGTRFQLLHTVLALFRLRARRRVLSQVVSNVQPDLVQALRLPYEGVTALGVDTRVPVVVSTWGSDFVPQAERDPLLRSWIRRSLPSARGLHVDALDDIRRARRLGLTDNVPTLYAAGNFGVEHTLFYPEPKRNLVVFPRRMTPGSNFQTFLRAVDLLREVDADFVGIGLANSADGQPRSINTRLTLTEDLDRAVYASYVRPARVVVSLNEVDGTANSVLEALACGARVVAARLPQYEQMAKEGYNIDLVQGDHARSVAEAIMKALAAPDVFAPSFPPEFSRDQNIDRVLTFFDKVVSLDERRR